MNVNSSRGTTDGRSLLSVSIVVYRPDTALLDKTIETLGVALAHSLDRSSPATLYLIDNGGLDAASTPHSAARHAQYETVTIAGHGNVGYGRGHNLAIERTSSQFHLVLNPDIELDADALVHALAFFDAHPATGLVSPQIRDDDDQQQFLCRRFPTVFDLFVRGFLPRGLRKFFANRLARYEMRDVINDRDVVSDPPIVSGCFMLFRTEVLKQLKGFDPRYFLYFEDYDLSLRTHEVARVAYVPSVRVVHHGGDAAKKGWTHIKLFIASAFKFFNRFGWKWL